ncbi:hypothetical protein F3Y22_tig00010417pilonHSYRG00011 [Hibiscus syriacus]|uniref:Uncharacterized protein n=1 Tax=Hibiscus syriacus TaxID=106335 RepID=A0A6A3C5M0_HIBSY|nr:hypothetical protein F3Y22_tig00010417pilonHSYRG00011 [Hibiscus syriacus]
MPESALTFLQSLEPNRDTYGFVVRSQHIHTYKQYVNIYKNEEKERLTRWKIFLDHLTKHTRPCLSEEESEETLHSKVGEANDEASIEVNKEDDDKEHEVTSSTEATELNEEVASEGSDDGDAPTAKPGSPESDAEGPFSGYATESEGEREVQLAEETKTYHVKRWAKNRPAICAIENMMESRVKKGKEMKYMSESGDHLPSIKDERFPD